MTSQQSMVSENGEVLKNFLIFFFLISIDKFVYFFVLQQIQGQQILIHSSVQQPNQNQLLQSPQVSLIDALDLRMSFAEFFY